MHDDDVFVIELGEGLRFTLGSIEHFACHSTGGVNDLDRNLASSERVLPAVHPRLSALTEQPLNLIFVGKGRADHEGTAVNVERHRSLQLSMSR